MTHATRRAARRLAALRGVRAEQVVAEYLEARGYQILGRNLRAGRCEIDLLAQVGAVAAVVEVRFRSARSWAGPFESIDPRKRDRLRAAAHRIWRERLENDRSVERLRFDVAAVRFAADGHAFVEYVEGAFV